MPTRADFRCRALARLACVAAVVAVAGALAACGGPAVSGGTNSAASTGSPASGSTGTGTNTGTGTGTASAGPFHPTVVQVHEATLAGDGHGVPGPRRFGIRFPTPTKPGDLLVAAVVDGVLTSGMQQPHWYPAGWHVAAQVIGGNLADGGKGRYATGGLQANLFYLPDNPGGITHVGLGKIPSGTQSDVTAFVLEIAGVPSQLSVDASGTSTSGPTPGTDTVVSTVRTSGTLAHAPDLVLGLFVNGGNAPHGEHFVVPHGWTVLAQDPAANTVNEPMLLDERLVRRTTPVQQRIEYRGGYKIDNCAVIAALH